MENNYPIGYETLLADFKRYQKQTPKGISMARKNGNIYLKFKVGDKSRNEYGCNCTFTLDGMVSALSKAKKISEALKIFMSEFLFVPIVRLSDVLGRFTLPITSSEKQLSTPEYCENSGNEVHIGYSDYGFIIRHFSRTCLPMTSPY